MALRDKTGFLLRHSYQTLNKGFRKKLGQENITTHQYVVLVGISELGQTIQRSLAQHVAIEPSNLNVMIKRLKSAGLVENVEEHSNAYRDTVRLTDRGKDLVDRLQAIEIEVTDQFLAPLSRAERERLHAFLNRLARI